MGCHSSQGIRMNSCMAHHGLLLAGSSSSLIQTVLSSTNKASDVILSNSDTQAESNSTSGGGIVLSVSGKGSGKYYFETKVTQVYSSNNSMGVGVHRGTSGLTTFLGGDADGWAIWDIGVTAGSQTYTNNVASNSAGSGDFVVNATQRIALDLDNGRVWLAASNRSSGAWIGGGDPAAGTSPTYSFTVGASTYYLAICPRRGDTSVSTNRNRLQLVLPSNWSFAAPSGFGVWT